MERTKIRWKNVGRGTLRLADKRIIKPGDIFIAAEGEISKAFRDTIKPVDPVPAVVAPVIPAVKVTFEKKHRGGGRYDVINQAGKVVNEKSMKKDEADALIEKLEG